MSAIIASTSHQPTEEKLAISFRYLLGLYIIIPICLMIYWLDGFIWNDYLLNNLPSSPSHFLLFQILFGTPHIIASSILLFSNKEYIINYQRKIVWMSLFIIAFFGIGSLFIPYIALYVITACWTVYHVLKQQHGIGKGICRLPTHAFYTLLTLSILAGICIYLGIFLKNSLTPQYTSWVLNIATALTLLLVLASAYCQTLTHTWMGKCYLWANTLMVVSSLYLYSQQYYFIAILVPRLIHDITAYSFYITHDYNKHHPQAQNLLYRYAKKFHLHIFIVLPILSFALAFLLQAYGDEMINLITRNLFDFEIYKAVTLGVIGYLALMHYYSESFIWSADSPLRQHIRFKS